jgi:hypothetical protein
MTEGKDIDDCVCGHCHTCHEAIYHNEWFVKAPCEHYDCKEFNRCSVELLS